MPEMSAKLTSKEDAAEKYAFGRCSRNHLGPNKSSAYFKQVTASFLAGTEWQRSQFEEYLREYRKAYDESLCPARKLEEFDPMVRTVVAFHMGRFLIDNMIRANADVPGRCADTGAGQRGRNETRLTSCCPRGRGA